MGNWGKFGRNVPNPPSQEVVPLQPPSYPPIIIRQNFTKKKKKPDLHGSLPRRGFSLVPLAPNDLSPMTLPLGSLYLFDENRNAKRLGLNIGASATDPNL